MFLKLNNKQNVYTKINSKENQKVVEECLKEMILKVYDGGIQKLFPMLKKCTIYLNSGYVKK